MIFATHRLGRPFFLEFEFYAALAAIGWGGLAYGTSVDMAQRPALTGLSFLSDDHWAAIVITLGAIQMACVLANATVGRWLVAIPLCAFWCGVAVAILLARWRGVPLTLATSLYCATAVCTFLKVMRLPKEFPPRAR